MQENAEQLVSEHKRVRHLFAHLFLKNFLAVYFYNNR